MDLLQSLMQALVPAGAPPLLPPGTPSPLNPAGMAGPPGSPSGPALQPSPRPPFPSAPPMNTAGMPGAPGGPSGPTPNTGLGISGNAPDSPNAPHNLLKDLFAAMTSGGAKPPGPASPSAPVGLGDPSTAGIMGGPGSQAGIMGPGPGGMSSAPPSQNRNLIPGLANEGSDVLSALKSQMSGPPSPPITTGSNEVLPWSPQSPQSWKTTVAPTPPSAAQGMQGKDVAQFFRNAFRGAASADPRAPAMSAFAQGGAGAMVGRHKEDTDAANTAAARDDKQFDRGIKTSQEARAQGKDKRDATLAKVQNAKIVSETMKNLRNGVTVAERVNISKALTNYTNAMSTQGLSGDALKQAVEAERQRIVGDSGGFPAAGGSAPPGRVNLGGPAPPRIGEVRDGFQFSGGDAANPGSWKKVQ